MQFASIRLQTMGEFAEIYSRLHPDQPSRLVEKHMLIEFWKLRFHRDQ